MVAPQGSPSDIARRGEEIYAERLRAQLEPQHNGKFIVIDVDTGEFEMDEDDLAASKRARQRFPGERRYSMRIGYRVADRLGVALGELERSCSDA